MLLFVPPYCRCHDDGRFRFTVIGCGLGLAVTSRFLWTAPYTNEILDVDTSKKKREKLEQQADSKPVRHIPLLCVQCKSPDDVQRNSPKHVEFYSKNKFEKLEQQAVSKPVRHIPLLCVR